MGNNNHTESAAVSDTASGTNHGPVDTGHETLFQSVFHKLNDFKTPPLTVCSYVGMMEDAILGGFELTGLAKAAISSGSGIRPQTSR